MHVQKGVISNGVIHRLGLMIRLKPYDNRGEKEASMCEVPAAMSAMHLEI